MKLKAAAILETKVPAMRLLADESMDVAREFGPLVGELLDRVVPLLAAAIPEPGAGAGEGVEGGFGAGP
jgi:hypothetical protein